MCNMWVHVCETVCACYHRHQLLTPCPCTRHLQKPPLHLHLHMPLVPPLPPPCPEPNCPLCTCICTCPPCPPPPPAQNLAIVGWSLATLGRREALVFIKELTAAAQLPEVGWGIVRIGDALDIFIYASE